MVMRIRPQYKYKITLPSGCKSPTNSVYKDFDIIEQSFALTSFKGARIIHSKGPFMLRYQLKSGKIIEKAAKFMEK
jgi:hypothetical protein